MKKFLKTHNSQILKFHKNLKKRQILKSIKNLIRVFCWYFEIDSQWIFRHNKIPFKS